MRLLLLTSLIAATTLTTGLAVNVTKLEVPSVVDPRNDKVHLRCQYDLGKLELYSVNWYKNNEMILRYMPSGNPKVVIYKNDGMLNVSKEQSNSEQLVLLGSSDVKKNKEAYEGTYVCEVSAEAPFPTAYKMANITVAILPQTNPVIEGLKDNYQVGEYLETQCISSPSLPAAELNFFVNGNPVNKSSTRKITLQSNTIPKNPSDMIGEISRLSLTLRLDRTYFRTGTLTLTCNSKLPGVPTAKVLKAERIVTLGASNNLRLERERLKQETSGNESLRLKLSLILSYFITCILFVL